MKNLCWSKGTPNWGDDCNPHLFKLITGEEPNFVRMDKPKTFNHYMAVGSILHFMNEKSVVWGTGLRFSDKKLKKPNKICAVRGPLTRDIVIKNNIECPEVYGDPVLLLPKFYYPQLEKKYKLGVIPHYIDKKYMNIQSGTNILRIDIQDTFENVIHNILQCEKIVSSSLHGLILADAYRIPAMWLKIGDRVEGSNLKFNDYFLSVGRDSRRIEFNQLKDIVDCFKYFYNYELNINLDKLYDVCPFKGK
jgi:pyruvyltransferase